jgi:hypothetical protein
VRALPLLLIATVLSCCATPEAPARVALRARLKQTSQLSRDDLGKTLDEIGRTLEGKKVAAKQETVSQELTKEQRDVVLGMLTERGGVFDEGLEKSGDLTVRVINAPGISANPEYSAARRLLVDVETFLPKRFEFKYEVEGMGDYAFDLDVQ